MGDDHRGAGRDHLRLDGDLGQVLDGADASADPAALADGHEGLVVKCEGELDAVDGLLQHPGTEWL
jgi:hypothetical protein